MVFYGIESINLVKITNLPKSKMATKHSRNHYIVNFQLLYPKNMVFHGAESINLVKITIILNPRWLPNIPETTTLSIFNCNTPKYGFPWCRIH